MCLRPCFTSELDRKMGLKSLQSNRNPPFPPAASDKWKTTMSYQTSTGKKLFFPEARRCESRLISVTVVALPCSCEGGVWMEMALPAPWWGGSCSDTAGEGGEPSHSFPAQHTSCPGLLSRVGGTGHGSAGWQWCQAGQLWSGSCKKKRRPCNEFVPSVFVNVLSLHQFLGRALDVFNPDCISP